MPTHSLEWKDSGNHGLYGGMFNRTGDSSGTETASLSVVLEFGGVRVAHLLSLLCCVVFLCLFVFVLCLVYPMLPLHLDCLFLIGSSISSNVDLLRF